MNTFKIKKGVKAFGILGSGIVLTVMTVFFAKYVTSTRQGLTGMAGTESKKANFFLYPSTVSQSEKSSFNIAPKLVGPEEKKISTILLSLSFDSSHIALTNIPVASPGAEMSVLKSSSLEDANKTGKIKILLGAESGEKAPIRVVNMPVFNFTIQKRNLSSISIKVSESQVVFSNQEIAEIQAASDVTVNSQIDPTATPNITITSIPTPTITLVPTATLIPTVTVSVSTPTPVITEPVPSITGSATQVTP